MVKLMDSFSLNVLADFPVMVKIEKISLKEAKEMVQDGFESFVSDLGSAVLFSNQLEVAVPAIWDFIALERGEVILLGQYRGPRLPEAAKTLPPGAVVRWFRVTVI